ncbi:hypothetical protein LTR91_003653 [Friedmanniomyces endolithicus]|uniref:Uncharacterized protein n=1 Tax=Friedmanniomyces endolithicus TaxID=329885 RepID=A0AAN6KYM1_9PEZI|nr:hypothetical protein LTR59_004261 [Friedmanniomyces endolithicus]KAK0877449.1 hypothetical protein LTR87_008700 [Friedmanniomyces endolithicus]KAK0920929.1 hypothetical protein LTR57_009206 [Friedmanniomyces endolithicus]KAK0999498.1 hypothetical protein LTS01_005266 [Friedmanniomyces endolithicus]KAK1006393.1 hypothetical protein LTR91_003653 [Friedmanniomyces endolithicus]
MAESSGPVLGNGKIVWTHEMRVAVWLLFDTLKFDRTTRTAVFNALYKDYLETLGLPDGANYSRIEAQYHEHRRSSAAWRATMISIASETIEQEELLSRIQDMASHLGYGIDHLSTLTRRADITDVPGTVVTRSRKRGRTVAPEAVTNPIERNKRATVGAGMTLSPPLTPPKTRAIAQIPKQRRPEATVLHSTETGHRVWLTPEEHLETQNAWVPVSDLEAHPPLAGGLLYRYVRCLRLRCESLR